MRGSAIYDYWAPPESIWSPWAKPTLFASVVFSAPLGQAIPRVPLPNHVKRVLTPNTAVVIDLAGADSVLLAAAISHEGFQPVPLYNGTTGQSEVVHLQPVLDTLVQEGPKLRALPPTAPPAFMLDSRRMAVGKPHTPGVYDNRWMTFPQDFPSAKFLGEQNISRVVVVGQGHHFLQDDLVHILLRWQKAGLHVFTIAIEEKSQLQEARLYKPGWFGFAFQRMLASMKLRRHAGAGFGSAVPHPSSGSGARG